MTTWKCSHCKQEFDLFMELCNHRVTDHPELDPITDEVPA